MSAPQFQAPGIEEVHELLPAYDVLDFIAKGGMGAVYRARQISLDREVAIKILPREFGEDEDFRKSFEAEAKAMAKLNHPNLIGVYDFGEVDGMPYIVMEFVNGKALHYSAHGKAIEQTEAARIVDGICKGLAHAHEAGILHRDIKPANILLDSKKQPKIGDFGLARPVESEEGHELVFGTPGYSAPEVLKGSSEIDKRSDVFSTGVILYELLTGELPGEHYVPASKKANVDPRFDQIIRRATHPSPSMRFPDAIAMDKEVTKLLDALTKPSAATIVTSGAAPKAKPAEGEGNGETPALAVPEIAAPPGPNWSFLRNLVIIGVLLAAIYGMWQAIQWKQANNERKEREFEAEQQKIKQEEAAKREAALAQQRAAEEAERRRRERMEAAREMARTQEEEKPKTPLEILGTMRRSLADGERTLFPPGTIERGPLRYFFVEKPMTWAEACAFAERHGAHLATLPNDAERNWLSTKIPSNTVIWLGGGAIGRSAWGWVDGAEWTIRKPSTAGGNTASLSDLGTVRAKPAGEEFPFFIQWNMEGPNLGSLQAQLERTTSTLDSPNPIWPPGTVFFESRRYLFVVRPVTWDEGAALARVANGHLTVPSDQPEHEFLKEAVAKALPAGSASWIGGQHNGRAWAWTTGEPWTFAEWAPGSPDGDPATDSAVRLLTGPDGGWDDASRTDTEAARAFIIEWSKDSETETVAATPTASGELARLRKLADGLVRKRRAQHKKEIFENGKSLRWDLDFWLRGLAESPKAQFGPRVLKVKNLIDDEGRFRLPTRERIELPGRPVEIIRSYMDKQERIDGEYELALDQLRVTYIDRLTKAKAELLEKGLKSQAQAIDNEIASSGSDGGTFLDHFTGESLPGSDR